MPDDEQVVEGEQTEDYGEPIKSVPVMKILVPTSFGSRSSLALEFALGYSQSHNAEVYLFHAHDTKTSDFRRLDRINEEMLSLMKNAVMSAIEILRDRGIHHAVGRVHRRISHGKAWMEILKISAGISADMVIMGAPRDSTFNRLITKAPCTIVLVKEKDQAFVVE